MRMELLREILSLLEQEIERTNNERILNGDFRLPKGKIILLGQFSLLADSKVAAVLNVPATMDLDAKLEVDWIIKKAFIKILQSKGLAYDEDSEKIWIPSGSKFENFHIGHLIECTYISPIFCILSKAIKAKEKNRQLVRDAFSIFGEKLIKLIAKNGGDPNYFIGE